MQARPDLTGRGVLYGYGDEAELTAAGAAALAARPADIPELIRSL